MNLKFSPSQLYVVCNILGDASLLFEVYTSIVDATIDAAEQGIKHNDDNTCYEVLPLDYYIQSLTSDVSLIQGFNDYHRD